jgi:predicted glutamine amidotransferase
MCRWAAYTGAPIFLEEIVSRPGHSLIHQSHCATQCHTAINADGFGIAWYGAKARAGPFPRRAARLVGPEPEKPDRAGPVAPVPRPCPRQTGTATSRNNCHPFTHGRWSFMHNGQVGGYDAFRRDADMMIPESLYPHRKGATDSEALFLVAMAEGLDDDPRGALERAAARFIRAGPAKGRRPPSAADGGAVGRAKALCRALCHRRRAPSLYHRWSDSRGSRPWCRNRWRPRRAAGRKSAIQLLHLSTARRDGRGFPALPLAAAA